MVALTMLCVGVAFAFTVTKLEPRAKKYEEAVCTEPLLKSTESAANNQKIALCFSLGRLQEDKSKISGLEVQVCEP